MTTSLSVVLSALSLVPFCRVWVKRWNGIAEVGSFCCFVVVLHVEKRQESGGTWRMGLNFVQLRPINHNPRNKELRVIAGRLCSFGGAKPLIGY